MNQLTIPMDSAPSFAAEDYIVSDSNRLAYNMIMGWPGWSAHALWLYGPPASGKTHLANIWAERSSATPITAEGLLSIEELVASDQACFLLDKLDNLDDAQQEGLFHLLNHIKAKEGSLLMVAPAEPKQLATLPDLTSRLKALPTISLDEPDDALLKAVWFKLFADRQLQVDPSVIDYLLLRQNRAFDSIYALTERLDHAALAQKRAITIPFVKSLLAE